MSDVLTREARDSNPALTPRALVVGRFPPPLDGQTVATAQLAHLLERLVPVDRLDVSAPEEGVAAVEGVDVNRVRHYLRSKRKLVRGIRANPGATVFWTNISPAPLGHYRDLLASFPALRHSDRLFAVVHHGDFHRLFERGLTRYSAGRLVARLTGIVFLTESLSERCAAWVPDHKRHVIPNTIAAERTPSASEVARKHAARQGRDEVRLLFVSNMIPSKGYRDFVDAVHLLKGRGVPVTARMAGRWPSQDVATAFQHTLEERGLSDTVHHLGSIAEPALLKDLHLWADIFVLPTYYPTEAQPLVLLEALSAGTPIITTRQGGIPEIITHGKEGFFVEPQSGSSIADAVIELIPEDNWRPISRAARGRFDEGYSVEAVSDQWRSLLQESAPDDHEAT